MPVLRQAAGRCMLCQTTIMRQIITFLLVLTMLTSCKGQDSFVETRLKTADKFVECLKNNASDKILDYSYPDVDHKISNKESRDFYVNKAFKFIKKFGLPKQDKWIIKYDPQNNFERLVITIPLFKGYDTVFNLLRADIVLTFPPPQISDKIYTYNIDDDYKMKPLIAPPLIDTTKRK
jgi:hypothetical protein